MSPKQISLLMLKKGVMRLAFGFELILEVDGDV